jgi:tetratricopeptide (TPR) repeat protein
MPSVWQKVLKERENVEKNPKDGEAWGRLGKLYKEIFFFRRGFRHDAGGQELYQLSVDAYEEAVALLPDDGLWHAGFADLLSTHAYYASWEGEDATSETIRSMQEIDLALGLAPNDPKVKEIAEKIYYFFPGAVELLEIGYDFLWLTATPVVDTPTDVPTLPTSTLQATPELVSTATAVPTREAAPNPTPIPPAAKNPLCGSAILAPLALFWFVRRKVYL